MQPSVLYSAEVLAARVRELGAQITQDYRNRCPVIIVVLKGSFIFAADLVRAIDLPTRVEFLGLRSYGDGTRSTGIVQITQDLSAPVQNEDVLVVEDIVDTGLTSQYLLEMLRSRLPKTLRLCSLLHKPARAKTSIPIDYLGFTIPDKFVVGYGLDYQQRYRSLPYLGIVEEP